MDFLGTVFYVFYGWPMVVISVCLALVLGILLMTILE